MKLLRSLVLAAALYLCPSFAHAQATQPTEDFQQTLSQATLAVYTGEQVCKFRPEETFFGPVQVWGCKFEKRFTCTATAVGKDEDNGYLGLSAGHCIDWANEDKYYVATSVEDEPVLHKITIVKSENDDRYDFVLFTFSSSRSIPTIAVDTDSKTVPALGTKVMTVHFAFGIGKQFTHGEVSSEELQASVIGGKQRFMITSGAGPGASGSAVVDVNTHKIIGLTEFVVPGYQMGTGVIPTGSRLIDFLDDDSAGIKPKPAPKTPPQTPDEEERFFNAIFEWLRAH